MDYRPLGNTGLRVSAVGFGAWQLANPIWGGPDEAGSMELVHAALDAGCNFYDTAPGYGGGASEQVLGKALKGRRGKVVLCTKYGHADPRQADFSVAGLRPSLEASLRRLQTDHVDLLLLHNPPRDLLDGARATDLYDELETLRCEGKLRVFGASIDTRQELSTLALTTTSGAAEVLFNVFHQDVRREFGEAGRRGLGLVAKVPLDSGWLSGKYDERSRFDGIRGRWSTQVVTRRAALLRRLRALLPPEMPLAQAALSFVLAHREIATVIPGAKTRAQVEANLAAASEPMPEALVAAIHALWETDLADDPLPW
jgi:aryl-alcohol dehydrogenase-like predicted oxidoreductase